MSVETLPVDATHAMYLAMWGHDVEEDARSHCNQCGAVSEEPLVVGCYLLVMRVMEVLGKRIVQRPRGRWKELGALPFSMAHTLWEVPADHLDTVLLDAWTHVPAMLEVYTAGAADCLIVEVALERVILEAVAEQRAVTVVDVRMALTPVLGN